MPTFPTVDDIHDKTWILRGLPTPNWQWCLHGNWTVTFNLHFDRPPSRFHRLMQRWILGIHWRPVQW